VPIALTPQHTAVAQLLQPHIGLGRAELEFGSKGPTGDVAVLLEIVGEQGRKLGLGVFPRDLCRGRPPESDIPAQQLQEGSLGLELHGAHPDVGTLYRLLALICRPFDGGCKREITQTGQMHP